MANAVKEPKRRSTRSGSRSTPVRVDNQLCFSLYAASRAATALYRPYLEKLNLTYPRYLVMLVLWEGDHISVGELGRRLFLDPGTLTPLLKTLAAGGLVTRTRDEDDERVVLIDLTDKGRALEKQCREISGTLGCKIAMPSEDVEQLRNNIWTLFQNLTSSQGECG